MLKKGTFVRYQGLGAGKVIDIVERPFRGKPTKFAVIFFPHRDMQAQIPADDPDVQAKLHPVMAPTTLKKMLKKIDTGGDQILPRTWDHREEMGRSKLT